MALYELEGRDVLGLPQRMQLECLPTINARQLVFTWTDPHKQFLFTLVCAVKSWGGMAKFGAAVRVQTIGWVYFWQRWSWAWWRRVSQNGSACMMCKILGRYLRWSAETQSRREAKLKRKFTCDELDSKLGTWLRVRCGNEAMKNRQLMSARAEQGKVTSSIQLGLQAGCDKVSLSWLNYP